MTSQAVRVTADSIDPDYAEAFVDIDEERSEPFQPPTGVLDIRELFGITAVGETPSCVQFPLKCAEGSRDSLDAFLS